MRWFADDAADPNGPLPITRLWRNHVVFSEALMEGFLRSNQNVLTSANQRRKPMTRNRTLARSSTT